MARRRESKNPFILNSGFRPSCNGVQDEREERRRFYYRHSCATPPSFPRKRESRTALPYDVAPLSSNCEIPAYAGMTVERRPAAPHPLILNLLKDGPPPFQPILRFPPPLPILQPVQDERKGSGYHPPLRRRYRARYRFFRPRTAARRSSAIRSAAWAVGRSSAWAVAMTRSIIS